MIRVVYTFVVFMNYFIHPLPTLSLKGEGFRAFAKVILTTPYYAINTTALAPSPLRERAGVRVRLKA